MTASAARERRAPAEPPTLELVLKRNSVERLKREKSPLGMVEELPALIASGYADVPEEDIVRLKWWGLYHDKPKVGTFMLRIKLAAGRLTPPQLQAIGDLSLELGRGEAELTTRQNVQLHYLRLETLPAVLERLHGAGLTSLGGCGDAVRAITGCPVAGIAHDELFDATPVVEEAHAFFTGHPDYVDLPRKHKIAIGACADRCFAPEINCIALVGTLRDGEPGFAVLVGGGLSSVPRIGRELGVFIRREEAIEVLRAILDAWREDLRYRVSRVKARLKFMIDDIGPEGMRAEVERRLGRALPDHRLEPLDGEPADHMGLHAQRQPGLTHVGVPVHLGLVSGAQLRALGELLERLGGEARVTRQQNLVLADVPDDAVAETVAELAALGLPLDTNPVRGASIACTGEPHCNFSVTETKTRLGSLIEGLEQRFGDDIRELRLHLDGCPHACAQHWVGDLGFQGTTARDASGQRQQAFDVYLRGAVGPRPAIARPVFRRVVTDELDELVAGLIGGWLEQRADGESFRDFTDRVSDEELGVLAGREPARSRREEAEAA
ncbi:MAG TPA: nitrite/sulfite reductase [Gaiella sp.]|jgi:ferredoxin-nitrite reductase